MRLVRAGASRNQQPQSQPNSSEVSAWERTPSEGAMSGPTAISTQFDEVAAKDMETEKERLTSHAVMAMFVDASASICSG